MGLHSEKLNIVHAISDCGSYMLSWAGNIRVYCRVRPFRPGENKNQTVVEHIGEHGELAITNSLKPKDAPKLFRFNKVYGPTAAQGFFFVHVLLFFRLFAYALFPS